MNEIAAWQKLQPTIWVVDNASHDDSVARIESCCPQVQLIKNETNQGFSGGTNCGIRAALRQQPHAPILLLNNDCAISEISVYTLMTLLEDNDSIGMVVPLLKDSAGNLIASGNKNPVFHLQTRLTDLTDGAEVARVGYLSGTAILIQAALFEKVDLLDERYFFSTELADLCHRSRQAGYHCCVDRRVEAFHDIERSADLRDTLYTYYIVRNRFIFLSKFYPMMVRRPLQGWWWSYSLLLCLKLYRDGQRQTARAVRLAIGDAWRGRFGGQNERVLAYVKA